MIRPTNVFSLDSRGAEQTGRSTLLLGERRIGVVMGSHVDAQFDCDGLGSVVFVSFKDIFSAVETIYFVDAHGRIRDHVSLGGAMEQGLISDIAVAGDDSIHFRFPMEEIRKLQVRHDATWFGLRSKWLHLR